jgi:hypothetical protein
MVSRGRHPKSEVAAVLANAKDRGLLVVEVHRGHRWGYLRCWRCGKRLGVWGTPQSPGTHARDLKRFVEAHLHAATPSPDGLS